MKSSVKTSTKNISGLLKSPLAMENLVRDLQGLGCTRDNITVLMSENTNRLYFSDEREQADTDFVTEVNSKSPEGFTAGALSGGLLGAVAGALALTGSLITTGGAAIVAAGPLVGALAGGAAGAAGGGLIGGLIGAGVPEVEAKFYNDAVGKEGNILVVAHVDEEMTSVVEELFKRHNAERIHVHG